jgi:hypothetical protein
MEGWVEIVEGLRPGDLLIGSERAGLSEGKKVRVDGEMNVESLKGSGGDHGAH